MGEERLPPEGYRDTGPHEAGMSNFLWKVDPDAEERLKTEKIFGHHAAVEFNGNIWFEDGVFHESVYRYGQFVDHYEALTLRELMFRVNDENGWA